MPAPPAREPLAEQVMEIALADHVMHHHGGQQQRRIRDAIHAPHPQAISRRPRPLLVEGHQQGGGQTDQLPAEKQRLDGAGQRGRDHAQQKHGVEDEEAVVAALAVQVARRRRRRWSRSARTTSMANGTERRSKTNLTRDVKACGFHPLAQVNDHMPPARRRASASGRQAAASRAGDRWPPERLG